MITRRVDGRWVRALPWCAVALMLSGVGAASAQQPSAVGRNGGSSFSGAEKPAEAQSAEQRLFPHGLPKIETMLKAALEHHPDVLAARGKLRAAEAEQRQAELKALKEVMEVRDKWEKANRAATAAGANHPMVRELSGTVAALEWELAFLLGTRGEMRVTSEAASGFGDEFIANVERQAPGKANAAAAPVAIDLTIPKGEQAKAIKTKLSQEVELNLSDSPLTDMAGFLSDLTDVRFILDKRALEDEGLPADAPVSLSLNKVELGSALQALEDLQKPLHFVVREYGILVTTEAGKPFDAVSVRDFWKLTEEEIREKRRQQLQAEMSSGGFLGGFGGGGGWGGVLPGAGGLGGTGGGGIGTSR